MRLLVLAPILSCGHTQTLFMSHSWPLLTVWLLIDYITKYCIDDIQLGKNIHLMPDPPEVQFTLYIYNI